MNLHYINSPELKLIKISEWIKDVFSSIDLKNLNHTESIYRKKVLDNKLGLNFLPQQKEQEECNLIIDDVVNYIESLDAGTKKLPKQVINKKKNIIM